MTAVSSDMHTEAVFVLADSPRVRFLYAHISHRKGFHSNMNYITASLPPHITWIHNGHVATGRCPYGRVIRLIKKGTFYLITPDADVTSKPAPGRQNNMKNYSGKSPDRNIWCGPYGTEFWCWLFCMIAPKHLAIKSAWKGNTFHQTFENLMYIKIKTIFPPINLLFFSVGIESWGQMFVSVHDAHRCH